MQLTHRSEEGEAPALPHDLSRIGIDKDSRTTRLREPHGIGAAEVRGYGDARDLYTIGRLAGDPLQEGLEGEDLRLAHGYRIAIVTNQLGDFLLEDEQSPREAGRHNDKPEGQGEPQMELPKEFAYSHRDLLSLYLKGVRSA